MGVKQPLQHPHSADLQTLLNPHSHFITQPWGVVWLQSSILDGVTDFQTLLESKVVVCVCVCERGYILRFSP